jgi:hypothetical protein
MAIAIANPTVRVNDETISIVPNSLTVKLGLGETNVRAASSGGGSVESVHTSDAETKISGVNFDIYNTPEMLRKISGWKNNIGGLTVQVVGTVPGGATFSVAMANVSLTNDPDLELAADGVTSLEFMGDPAQVG